LVETVSVGLTLVAAARAGDGAAARAGDDAAARAGDDADSIAPGTKITTAIAARRDDIERNLMIFLQADGRPAISAVTWHGAEYQVGPP
jgi:hypothetical protein